VHTPPRVRGGLVARLVALLIGLFLFALGIVCQLESKLGLSPWDTLHQGIAKHSPLSFGVANIVVGAAVLAVAWALGARIGFATFANAFFVGAFIVALSAIPQVDGLSEDPLGVRIALLALSMPLYGLGSALYLGAWLGAGPRDSLMVVLGQRTGIRLGVVRAAIELCALVAGFALGGTIGVGTVVFALTIGPALEAGFWALQRSRFGATEPPPTSLDLPVASSSG
jgi:uncharacterized membrane protein YczE